MTAKQELFIVEYLKDFNATQAAIRAGYSKETAYSIGSENLSKPEIKEAISKRLEEMLGSKYKAVYENIRFWERMRDGEDVAEAARIRASEMLAKYYEMFTDRIEISGNKERPVIVSLESILEN